MLRILGVLFCLALAVACGLVAVALALNPEATSGDCVLSAVHGVGLVAWTGIGAGVATLDREDSEAV